MNNTPLPKALVWFKNASTAAVRRFSALTLLQKVLVVAGAIIIVVLAWHFLGPKSVAVVAEEKIPHVVEVRSVSSLSEGAVPLSAVGTVSSKSEATVLAQKSGEIVAVHHALGDYVSAGSVVAQLENASERAAVLQAKGAVDAATANLAKVKAGTRTEQLSILQTNVATAKTGAVNTLLASYGAIDGAVRGTLDAMFSNPTSARPQFNITTSNTQAKTTAENMRSSMGPLLAREAAMTSSVSSLSDLLGELTTVEGELRTTRTLFDTALTALGAAVPSGPDFTTATINTDIANATAARTAITAALGSLSAARASLEVAQKSLDQGVTGAQQEDVDAVAAALTSAQSAYAAAQANLAKTYITAPISGTINSFSLKQGDYVQPSSPVLTVANNGALEVVVQITEEDSRSVTSGTPVMIEGSIVGRVTRIAPALDPITKKVEVRIDVSGARGQLINGQSVNVEFSRAQGAKTPTKAATISIPIAAIKVGSDAMSVFTVSASSTLESHAIVVGQLQGDRVVVSSGITPDMIIVTDARGLRAGDTVSIASSGGSASGGK